MSSVKLDGMPNSKLHFDTTERKCPICGKGDIPYPLDNKGCGYCRHCGASNKRIQSYVDMEIKFALILDRMYLLVKHLHH